MAAGGSERGGGKWPETLSYGRFGSGSAARSRGDHPPAVALATAGPHRGLLQSTFSGVRRTAIAKCAKRGASSSSWIQRTTQWSFRYCDTFASLIPRCSASLDLKPLASGE